MLEISYKIKTEYKFFFFGYFNNSNNNLQSSNPDRKRGDNWKSKDW